MSELLKTILLAGSDRVETFGGAFTGGVCLQQDPHELESFIDSLPPGEKNYLEIGAAAGGLTALLSAILDLNHITVIDDNKHVRAPQREALLSGIVENEFIGDSHSPECAEFLKKLGLKFDLIFIDGDHTTPGILADVDLVRPYIADGGLVAFHDSLLPEVRTAIRAVTDLSYVKNFASKFGIAVMRKEIPCPEPEKTASPVESPQSKTHSPEKSSTSTPKPPTKGTSRSRRNSRSKSSTTPKSTSSP